jgi:hypothetical protein
MECNTICIYRYRFKNLKCNCKCDNILEINNKLCKKHIKFKSELFNIISESCGTKNNLLNINDIYIIYQNIYDNNIYSDTKKKFLFIKIINYLFNFRDIYGLCSKINIKVNYKYKKPELIENLYKILNNTYFIKRENNILKNITINKIQNFFRKNIVNKIHKLYNNNIIENTLDPFTLDNINEISINNRYTFINNNRIYSVNAIEFEYYLRNNNTNPYTNEILCNIDNIKKYLNIFINYYNLKIKPNMFDFNWTTPSQAYTDVVYYIERIGFYNNILWFIELSYNDIINVINIYLENSNLSNNIYFNQEFMSELNETNYIYNFSKEIINLFKDGNNHYLLCCYFIKSLGLVSNSFNKNLPSWLLDIDNTINIFPQNIFRLNIDFNTFNRIGINEILNNENNEIELTELNPMTLYYLMNLIN